jgi:hypothetical protein
MKKFIEHNCLVWNSNEWKSPSLDTSPNYSKTPPSFAAQYGFGHEEWNNTDRFRAGHWRGFFTTAQSGPVRNLAATQRLCIVMTSRNPKDGEHYLVGAAVDVQPIDPKLRLHLRQRVNFASQEFWPDPNILKGVRDRQTRSRDRHKLRLRQLLRIDVPWMCRTEDFWWAPREHRLYANDMKTDSGKPLTWRWAQSQPLRRPQDVRSLLVRAKCRNRSVLDWFSDGEFDTRSGTFASSVDEDASQPWRRTGAAAKRPYQRYVESYEIDVQPQHETLKEDFVRFGASLGFQRFDAKHKSVDLVGQHRTRGRIFMEVKPATTIVASRFAVRLAIGQLLEYKFYESAKVDKLMIVIGCRPRQEVINFAHSHKIGCAWPAAGGKFQVAWA